MSGKAMPYLAHFHRHGGDGSVSHRHVLRHGSQAFVPELEVYRPGPWPSSVPWSFVTAYGAGDYHSGPHPGGGGRSLPGCFRCWNYRIRNRPPLVKPPGGFLVLARQVMHMISVQEFHRAADWHYHDARHEHALLLIHLHHRQGHRPFRAGRRGLEGHHNIAMPFSGSRAMSSAFFASRTRSDRQSPEASSVRRLTLYRTVPLIVPPMLPPATMHHTTQAEQGEDGLGRFLARRGPTVNIVCISLFLRWLHGHCMLGLQGAGPMQTRCGWA